MKLPEGFVDENANLVHVQAQKEQQSSRCWNATLDFHLKEIGFTQSTSDPCMYVESGGDGFCIGVYE